MNTTDLQTPKRKELSASASFEIVMSVIAFISLLLPLATVDFLGKETSFNYFQMNKTFMVWIAYALPIIHILVKLYIRNSWLPLLTSFFTTFFLLGIIIEIGESLGSSNMGYGVSMGLNPAIGYYMIWAAFVGFVISLLVSWTLFLGNKIVNYKRWIIISIALIGLGILGFIIGCITNSLALALLLNAISPIGLIILPGALCSYFIHRKEKGEQDNSKSMHISSNALSKVTSNVAKAFQKLPHKKEITIGALAVIAIIIGVFMCGGGDKVNFEVQLPAWNKFVTVEDNVNLRQAPDTNSPRLMEEQGEMDSQFVWENEMNVYGMPRTPFRVGSNVACPVLTETAGWYEILVQMVYGYDDMYTQKVYVMKKFCKEVTPQPIANSYFYKIAKGKYKGKYLYYDMGGMFAMPSSLTLGLEIDGGYVFPKMFKHEFANNGGPETYDFSQITNEMLQDWFDLKTQNPIQRYDLYYNFAGIGLNRYSINLMEYQGKLR